MSVITDTWRQLVRRRLWPIAVLLLGGLVAVPMLLAKSPAAPTPAPVPVTSDKGPAPAGGGLDQPIVAMADAATRGRRHVLGPAKDPFRPAPLPKAKKADTPGSHTATAPTTSTGGSDSSTGGSTGSPSVPLTPVGGGSPYTPGSPITPGVPSTPTTPSGPKPKPAAPGTLTVRFGDATSSSLLTLKVKKLDALPDPDQPVVIYLGPGRSAHTAQFLIDSTVRPEGDGSCLPSPSDCQTVELHQGETEFLTVTTEGDGSTTSSATQYELDLVKVVGKPKAKSSRAHHARARHARAARVGVTIARVVKLLQP